VPYLEAGASAGIELDLCTLQLTLKAAHLKALPRDIAETPDVLHIFGKASMQAATIQVADSWAPRTRASPPALAHSCTPSSSVASSVDCGSLTVDHCQLTVGR
jgi:hypothetical protein